MEPGISPAVAPETDRGILGRHATIEERRRLVAESLQIGNPANNANDLPDQADPCHDCQVELDVDVIHPFEHNPRRAINTKFVEIKESIRSCGVRNPLTVTRRPGEAHFIVEAGGNTRLLAMQELWAETQDLRFRKITVLFRPWRSESHVLTAHLIENEQRGEMTFWDKANGVVKLKGELELEKGHALSLRQLEEELKAIGMSVNPATLSHYLFATNRLRTLGEGVASLSGLDVKSMQPRLNLIKRYAQLRASFTEDELYAEIFEPVFVRHRDQDRHTPAFSASALCQACEEALAQHFGEPVKLLRTRLDMLARSVHISLEDLLAEGDASPPAELTHANGRYAPSSAPRLSTANTVAVSPAARPMVPPPARATDQAPIENSHLIEQVSQLAGLAGIGECLHVDPATPHGYFMQALPTGAHGDKREPIEQRAWTVLALISGQLDGNLSAAPPAAACEAPAGLSTELACVESEPPQAILLDAGFFDWLLNAQDEAAVVLWRILTLVREQRASVPLLHLIIDGDAESVRSA